MHRRLRVGHGERARERAREQALAIGHAHEGLGIGAARHRPQARAGTTGEDHGDIGSDIRPCLGIQSAPAADPRVRRIARRSRSSRCELAAGRKPCGRSLKGCDFQRTDSGRSAITGSAIAPVRRHRPKHLGRRVQRGPGRTARVRKSLLAMAALGHAFELAGRVRAAHDLARETALSCAGAVAWSVPSSAWPRSTRPCDARQRERGDASQQARRGRRAVLVVHHGQAVALARQAQHGAQEVVAARAIHPGRAQHQVLRAAAPPAPARLPACSRP